MHWSYGESWRGVLKVENDYGVSGVLIREVGRVVIDGIVHHGMLLAWNDLRHKSHPEG